MGMKKLFVIGGMGAGKSTARKVRRIYHGRVLAGFAGSVADAFTLFEKFEAKLETYNGNLQRAAVELAKEWRTDKMMGKLEALLLVADKSTLLMLSGNGEVIATSEVYSGDAACKKGIESVRKNAVEAKLEDQTVAEVAAVTNPKFEVYTDKSGEFRFRLKARNGEIIAVSEGYKAKASCLNGIESVRKNAPDAPVVAAE